MQIRRACRIALCCANRLMRLFEPSESLWELIALYCDGGITAGELRILSEALRQDIQLRNWFLRYITIHAELQWEAASVRLPSSAIIVRLPSRES